MRSNTQIMSNLTSIVTAKKKTSIHDLMGLNKKSYHMAKTNMKMTNDQVTEKSTWLENVVDLIEKQTEREDHSKCEHELSKSHNKNEQMISDVKSRSIDFDIAESVDRVDRNKVEDGNAMTENGSMDDTSIEELNTAYHFYDFEDTDASWEEAAGDRKRSKRGTKDYNNFQFDYSKSDAMAAECKSHLFHWLEP